MNNNVSVLNFPFIFRHRLFLKWRISLKIFLVFSSFVIIGLLGLYIFQVNVVVSEKYLIQKYEKQISEILKENQNLAINSTKLSSLTKVIKSLEELNFEKIDKIYYIRVLNNQMVAK